MKKWIIILIILGLAGYAVFDFVSTKKEEEAKKDEMITATQTEMEVKGDKEEVESAPKGEVGIEQGNIAPDFELETMDGEKVKLSDYRGQKVLLNFWATWCPPCRSEMPDMQKVHDEFGEDVVILAVNLTETESSLQTVTNFLQELEITFTILQDVDTMIATTYQANALPTSYLLNTDGSIHNIAIGPLNYDSMIKAFQEMY
ncbi:peroxiredoxin family protein [Pseudogracilibacillus sp. ICA-222130]|uniref:peroxiredoxin family protein n=1 Tax=Pseudogracilibacillus sp. ICA-222130 TaxID=3134655 RepID=UPI0030C3C2D6